MRYQNYIIQHDFIKYSKRYQKGIDFDETGRYNIDIKKKSEGDKVRFLISVPETLHSKLKDTARQNGQTLTGLIRQILWDWLNAQAGKDDARKDV